MNPNQHKWGIPLPPVPHITLNESDVDGYDEILIIGDVHGCYNEMIKCIQEAHRGTDSRILKIFVGDLVNKGERNLDVLRYIMENQQNCLSVRGNHEEKVIREYLEPSSSTELEWVREINSVQFDYLVNLPYTITIPKLRITIVHAGLVPGIELEDNDPFFMVRVRNLMKKTNSDTYIPLKKTKEGKAWAALWTGPTHIYFGHDARRGHQVHEYATGLDTGCVYGGQLTAIFVHGPRKGTYITIGAERVYWQDEDDD